MDLVRVLADKRLLYAITAVTAILLAVAGYYIRMQPFYNYGVVAKLAEHYGIPKQFARYAYLNANDPWIEYWLANYLHQHGLGSWRTLTRDNPATHIFWYPWGRDFTKSEYPLVPMMGSLGSDPLVSTDILPAVAGACLVLAAYLFAAAEYGPLAGLIAALLAAFLPAATSRTFAGFVEKTGIAMPFIILAILFYTRSITAPRRLALIYAAATGILWSLAALTWGGYGLVNIAVALTVLLAPLSVGLEASMNIALVSIVATTVYTAISYPLAALGYGRVSTFFIAATYLAILFTYAAAYILTRRTTILPERYVHNPQRLYAYLLIALLLVSPLPLITLHLVGGKYIFTLFWPLRDLGLLHTDRIGETVAEMAGVLTHGRLRSFLYETNVVGIFAPLAALYLLYLSLRRGELKHLPLASLSLLLSYAVLGMLYLTQSFASIGLLAVAAVSELLVKAAFSTSEVQAAKRRTRARTASSTGLEELYRVVAVSFVIIILIGSVFAAKDAAKSLHAVAATITGGSINRVYLGWLWTLNHLAAETPKDTVVVAWWDYGYWISVGSGRASVADGATLNSTQIRLLAKAFTGNEDEASRIFHLLRLKPGHTLVLFNDLVVYNPKAGAIIYPFPNGGIDLLKSWAMHHIAARDQKFNKMIEAVRSILINAPNKSQAIQELRSFVNNTLVFKMMTAEPYYLSSKGVVVPEAFKQLVGNMKVSAVYLAGVKMPKYKLRHFEPYMVVLAPFMNSRGKPIVNPDGSIPALIITIYRWTG